MFYICVGKLFVELMCYMSIGEVVILLLLLLFLVPLFIQCVNVISELISVLEISV